MTVSTTLAMAGFVAALAVLCLVVRLAMRSQPALVWLGCALTIGVVESLALKDGQVTAIDAALVLVTVPSSYICVGQAVRAAYGLRRSPPGYFALAAALVLTSFIMHAAGAPPVVQTLFCQIAGVLALADMTRSLWHRRRPHDLLDNALLGFLGTNLLVYTARIPFFPVLLGQDTPFPHPGREALQGGLVAIFAVIVPAVVFLIVGRVVGDAIENWRERAERDFMTDLPNRRAFEDFAKRGGGRGGSLILCDIDRFKAVNDRFGHAAGDAVICAFAQLLEGKGRAARIGGEEFAVWLPDCDIRDAQAHAERLRREFETLRIVDIDTDLRLSASFGIASFGRFTPLELVTSQADAALYAAKNAGRNRVVVHGAEDVDTEVVIPQRQISRAA